MLDMLHSRLFTVFKNYPAPESNSDIYDKQVALRSILQRWMSFLYKQEVHACNGWSGSYIGKNAESSALPYKTMALQRG
jgi:hypothetical protein